MANQITFQEDPGLAPEHVIDPGLARDEELGPARESETDTGPAPDTATEMAEALSVAVALAAAEAERADSGGGGGSGSALKTVQTLTVAIQELGQQSSVLNQTLQTLIVANQELGQQKYELSQQLNKARLDAAHWEYIYINMSVANKNRLLKMRAWPPSWSGQCLPITPA